MLPAVSVLFQSVPCPSYFFPTDVKVSDEGMARCIWLLWVKAFTRVSRKRLVDR